MTLYRTKKAILVRGTRYEKNTEVELSDDVVAQIGLDDIDPITKKAPAPVKEEVKEPEVEPEELDLDKLTLDELKAKAEELGLSASGRKSDLVERIKLALSAKE